MKRPYIGSLRFPLQSWAIKVHTGLYENVPTVKVSLWDLKNKSHVHHVLAQNSVQGTLFNYGFQPNLGPLESSFFGPRGTEILLPRLYSLEVDQLREKLLGICNVLLPHLNKENAINLYEQFFRRAAYNILNHGELSDFTNPPLGVYITPDNSIPENLQMMTAPGIIINLKHQTPPQNEMRYFIELYDINHHLQSDHWFVGRYLVDDFSLRIYPHIWDLIIGKS